jgi:transposase
LGSISKRGNVHLRMLLVQRGRAVLYSADCTLVAGRPLDALRKWAPQVRARIGRNKAAVAVANKLARILWATCYRQRDYEFRPSPAVSV